MKIQIDTNSKTIKIEENIKFSELISGLKKLFPNDEWKDYRLESNSVLYWNTYPIIRYDDNITIPWWQQQPYYTTGELNINSNVTDGVNVGVGGVGTITTNTEYMYTNTNYADGEENQGIPNGIFNVEL